MAAGRVNKPVAGDRYVWHGIEISVGEVDPAGRWAMIHCVIPPYQSGCLHMKGHEWDKRQPTPDGEFPDDWEQLE
jgi:hypothetical protein